MLLETGIRSNEAGVDMLAAYARQLTKEALLRAHNYAEHADRNQIEVEDITLGFNSLSKYMQPHGTLLELSLQLQSRSLE